MNFHWSGYQHESDGDILTNVHVEIHLCEGPRTNAVERCHIMSGGKSGWIRYFERQVQTIKADNNRERATWYDNHPNWT